MTFKRIILTSLVVFFLFAGYAQEEAARFRFSFFAGAALLGVKNDMESNMKESGLGDTSYSSWFGGSNSHPSSSKAPAFDFEATYFFSEKGGISANIGITDNIEIRGYDDIGFGNALSLKSDLWSVSVAYTFRTLNQSHQLTVGPSFYQHRIKETSGLGDNPVDEKYTKPGAYFSYSYLVVNRKLWILALRANFRWAPKSEIGPYEKSHTLGSPTVNSETYTSVFKQTDVNLSVFEVGLAIGLNAGR